MKINCHKNDLLNGVNTSLKAVSTRTTLPILQCILLQATQNEFKLISNDLEIGIESHVKANIIESGSVAIDARIFSEIVKKLPDAMVDITVDESNMTTIVCQKSIFNIPGQPGTEFIQLPQITKDTSISIKQSVLKDMIHQTLFSIAIKEIKPILTGELIEIKENALSIISMDGYRISIRKVEFMDDFNNTAVVVPGKTLSEISKILSSDESDMLSIYFTDKHVLFELEDSIVVSRLLEGDYPKYANLFSGDYETLITVNRKELMMSIERAALIARESKKSPVKFEIKEDTLLITSNTELGNVHEELMIVREGQPIDIAFNPKYLLDALKAIEDEEICMQFTNALNPCIVRQVEGEDYKYLILPIRLNG
ncbi:MAG: DNA polymerase III subunit beta [Firmicutes bacterium HGW-Firmicutes-3]|jgi:DNA polymerase-3 subunit beta|nr:MAG: DNA polymerase III subunit beta [Firmicutes bacterium HGW-Firmicutes-3]